MSVGSLKDICIEPIGVGDVGPIGDRILAVVHAAVGGVAADETVEDSCGLCTGQQIIGICGAVCVDIEDAQLPGTVLSPG